MTAALRSGMQTSFAVRGSAAVIVAALIILGPAAPARAELPVSLEVGQRAVALPLGTSWRDFWPVGVVGTEFEHTRGRYGSLHQKARLGVMGSPVLGPATWLQTDLAYRYTTARGPLGEVSLGLGYAHAFYPRPIYRQQDDGRYARATDRGTPGALLGAGASVGYDFDQALGLPLTALLSYQWLVQTPFLEILPAAPQSIVSLGVRVRFQRRTQET
jgi:hypothetical protein